MAAPAPARDQVAQSVAAVSRSTGLVPVDLVLSSGRPARLIVPGDISDIEWLSLVGAIPEIRDGLAQGRGEAPAPRRLWLPGAPA